MEGSYIYYPIKENRISVDLDNPQKASLFDYFKQIELIPLETNDDVLIGRLEKVIYHQNKYYTLDYHQFIVQVFDESGKFISKIGRRGQGPGDYLRADNMTINPFTGDLDILETFGRILTYDLSGNHIKTFRVADHQTDGYDLRAIHGLFVLSERVYVFIGFAQTFLINYYDMDEHRIFHQEFAGRSFAGRHSSFNPFYEYHGKYFFYNPLCNNTYEFGPESLVKSYTWDFGKHNYDASEIVIPEEYYRDRNKMEAEYRRLPYQIILQGQNNRYVMAQIRLNNDEFACLMYDKSTGEYKFIEHFAETVEFLPLQITNEYVLSYCNHVDLEKHVKSEILDETNRQKFNVLMNAKEEENPIIIKYYFK
jgi:hypothetical protein